MIQTLERTFEESQEASAASVSLAVDARAVTKTYGSNGVAVHALRGVDLAVEHGEMVAIMGQSGCGKTTLLNCLSGLDDIDSGEIRIDGDDIALLTDRARTGFRARRMGFVFQTYNLLPVLSAAENVALPLIVAGVSTREARDRAAVAMERVGLRGKESSRPSQLSGGQRQRVAIARALVNRPRIVWADEPTGALDSGTAEEVMCLMEELNRDHGLTFVVVTHDPSVGQRCHRIVHMQDGRVLSEEKNS